MAVKILKRAKRQEYKGQKTCSHCGTVFEYKVKAFDTENRVDMKCPVCGADLRVQLRCPICKEVFCREDDTEHNIYCKKCRNKGNKLEFGTPEWFAYFLC